MEDEIRAASAATRSTTRSSAAAAARSTSTTWRSSACRRRARSSCSRRRSTIPTPTSSRRSWRSPTTPTGATEPYHDRRRDPRPAEHGGGAAGRRDEAELVLGGELIARITAQTCRQSGLSVVYIELLDFGGDEIYFNEEPELVGRPSATRSSRIATRPDRPRPGGRRAALNPPMDTRHRGRRQADRHRRGRRHDPRCEPDPTAHRRRTRSSAAPPTPSASPSAR